MKIRSMTYAMMGVAALSCLFVSSAQAGAEIPAKVQSSELEWEAPNCDEEPDTNPCHTFDHDGAQVVYRNDTGFFIKAIAVRRNDQGQIVERGRIIPGGAEVADLIPGQEVAWDFTGGSEEPGLHFSVVRVM